MSTSNFCDAGQDINATADCPTPSQASCTKEVCCFDLMTCDDADGQITCPAGKKFMPTVSCGGISVDSCTTSDCCQDYATCVNFDADNCADDEFKEHANTCPGVTDDSCTKGHCCAARAFCPADFECGSQTANTSVMCDGVCSVADCCPPYDASYDASSNCTVWQGSTDMSTCPSGTMFLPDGDCPEGCSQEVCCEAQETCSSKQNTPNFCPNGTDIDTAQVCPSTHSTSCTTDVCCKDLVHCSDAFAAGRISCTQATQVQVPQISCGGISLGSCQLDECCQDYATCLSFNASRCDDNEVRVSSRTCVGTLEGSCTKARCCTARMYCPADLSSCDAGTVNTSAMCAGETCEASDEAVCCPSGTSESSVVPF
jgi:hypothetical protein